jgi:intracellular septation protein
MQTLLNFLPLLAFLITYKWRDIYAATAVLMVTMVLATGVEYLWRRKVSGIQLGSVVLVLIAGSATLLLRDPRFLQWKPTIFLGGLALAFLLSERLGKAPLVQYLFQAAYPQGTSLPRATWLRLNRQWVAVYALLAGANWWFAFHRSEVAWVNFKVFGLTAVLLAVAAAQAIWLMRQNPEKAP